jgi:hypothetical protein
MMPTLTDEIKAFMVKGLACFDTPSQVAEAVKANFDVEVCRQHVFAYDPASSQTMSPRWRELHAATRAAFLSDVNEIGIAQKAVRLRTLERMAERAEANRQYERVSMFLEQAARECGGAYERRRFSAPPKGPASETQ